MATFATRSAKGEQFATEVFQSLQSMGFNTALNGTEHTHPQFTSRLRASNDPTSMAIRYQPDGVCSYGATSPASAYIEAKCSKSIERDAFMQYKRLSDSGCIVIVVCGNVMDDACDINGWTTIQCMRFKDPTTCNTFRRSRSGRVYTLPVIDGWISPRESAEWAVLKNDGFSGSGTPYAVIDQTCLLPWTHFEQSLKGALLKHSTS